MKLISVIITIIGNVSCVSLLN